MIEREMKEYGYACMCEACEAVEGLMPKVSGATMPMTEIPSESDIRLVNQELGAAPLQVVDVKEIADR